MASLIDLHTHTSYSSACGRMTAEELIEAAIDAGLNGVAVTEHSLIGGAEVAQEVARRKYGFPVFRGVEAHATIFGDVLVFGCHHDFEPGIPWSTLRRLVVEAGGLLIPAHPFRRWDHFALWSYLEDQGLSLNGHLAEMDFVQGLTAIEVHNGGCRPEENAEAAELVKLTYFGGLALEQAAEVLGVSSRTAYRHLAFARAWLYEAISEEDRPEASEV